MKEDTTQTIEGYHGTIFENLGKGLDRVSRHYDKSRAGIKVAIPERLDLASNIHHSIVLAYRLGWETSEDNSLYSMDATERAVLLYGRRLNASTMKIQRVMRFLLPQGLYLSRWPLNLLLEDMTEEFFER